MKKSLEDLLKRVLRMSENSVIAEDNFMPSLMAACAYSFAYPNFLTVADQEELRHIYQELDRQ
jgi:hypothetical protein